MERMTQTKGARLGWLDLVRVLAILMVILVHSAESAADFTVEGLPLLSASGRALEGAAFSVGRLGVPLFLLSSGWLLLDRDYSDADIRSFYRRRWVPLLVITQAWNVIYFLLLVFCFHRKFTGLEVFQMFFFLRPHPMSHMWYMPMILGWYLLIPFMARGLRQVELSTLRLPMLVLCLYGFAMPTIGALIKTYSDQYFYSYLPPGITDGGFYGIYLVLGYMVRKKAFRSLPGWLLAVTVPLGTAASCWIMLNSFAHGVDQKIRYYLLPLMLASVCLFELLSRMEQWKAPKAVSWLARYSFPLYLTHNPFRMLLQGSIQGIGRVSLRLAVTFAASAALGLLAAWLISLIPRVGKKLLYMK